MNKLFPLLITSLLFSQINVKNQRMNNIQDALFMERKGELENAKIIYEKLLDQKIDRNFFCSHLIVDNLECSRSFQGL